MGIFKIAGKFLDQPILVAKFKKTVPYLLGTGGAVYCAQDIKKSDTEDKKKTAIKTGLTMGVTIASALAAPNIVNKIFKVETKNLKQIKQLNTQIVDEFISKNIVDNKTKTILEKAKEKVLVFKEVKHLNENLGKTPKGSTFLDELIPNPENITSKEIFSEIGRLSVLGLIPVIGGISGGIVGDALTEVHWKSKLPDKIKEGTYQYLANIFLCNVGAGLALALMEKSGVKSKAQRAIGMICGIVMTGIIGGSAIANLIGNKLINPIFGKKTNHNIYKERKPEALDIGLHVDDIATVAVMSGLKWIEPALPIMYSISGYRAGIGYRNNNVKNCNNKN